MGQWIVPSGRNATQSTGRMQDVWFLPSPLYGLFFPFDDISRGGRYNNFGIHGSGISTAADSLAAIKRYVFEEKSITPADYIAAVDADFEGRPELLAKLRYDTPKMGNDDEAADAMAVRLLDSFARCAGGQAQLPGRRLPGRDGLGDVLPVACGGAGRFAGWPPERGGASAPIIQPASLHAIRGRSPS